MFCPVYASIAARVCKGTVSHSKYHIFWGGGKIFTVICLKCFYIETKFLLLFSRNIEGTCFKFTKFYCVPFCTL
jgi:hypothetical protein